MKKLFPLILILFSIAACSEPPEQETEEITQTIDSTVIRQQSADSLRYFIKRLEDAPQVFTIPTNKISVIKGVKGSVWHINPTDLETVSGTPIGGEIRVELKELTTSSEFVKNNVQTISDNRILSSGGSYYIRMTTGAEELKIKSGSTIKAEFPKIAKGGMSLFYGERDVEGAMNWKECNTTFRQAYDIVDKPRDTAWFTIDRNEKRRESIPAISGHQDIDSIMSYVDGVKMTDNEKKQNENYQKANRIYKDIYMAIEIENLGWLNVDKYLKSQLAPLYVSTGSNNSSGYTQIYIVMKAINSMLQNSYFDDVVTITSVPEKTDARIIALRYENNKMYFGRKDVTFTDSNYVQLDMKEADESDVLAFLD